MHLFIRACLSVTAFAAYVALTGCTTPDNGVDQTDQPTGADAAGLQTAEIVGVLEAIHTAEIDQAQYMLREEVRDELSSDVAEFAQMMVDEHTQLRSELEELIKQENADPARSMMQARLAGEAAAVMANMRAVRAVPVFDLEASYINGQVTMHQRALDVIEDTLLPAATKPAMVDYLQQARTSIRGHLDRAEQIQARLEGEEPPPVSQL